MLLLWYLNPGELHYYLLMVSLDRFFERSCNNVDNPFGKICVPWRIGNVNLKLFNIIKETNESKTLIKHISKNSDNNLLVQNVIQFKNRITESVYRNIKSQQNMVYAEEDYIWNPSICTYEFHKDNNSMWRNCGYNGAKINPF